MRSNYQNITDTGLDAGQTDMLRNASVNPPAGAWPKIQHSIRRKSQLIFLYRAAAVVALSGSVVFMLQRSGTHSVEIQQQAATRPVEKSDSVSASGSREEAAVAAGPVAVSPKSLPSVHLTVEPPQSHTDVQAIAEDTVLPENVSEYTDVSEVDQSTEPPSVASVEEASHATAGTPITIIYELPAPEYEAPRRQVTVSRIFGLAADLKSGQSNLGLFRSIRQVFSESARRNNQQNTNLQ